MNTTTTSHNDQQAVLLSKKGLKELRRDIAQLEHDRTALTRSLRETDKSNDHDSRLERVEKLQRLETVEAELHEKQQLLHRAKLLPTRRTRMKVAVGSVVDLIDQQGKLFRYTLVESIEANPSDGRISVLSPLGKMLVGKAADQTVEWNQGTRQQSFKLVRIS